MNSSGAVGAALGGKDAAGAGPKKGLKDNGAHVVVVSIVWGGVLVLVGALLLLTLNSPWGAAGSHGSAAASVGAGDSPSGLLAGASPAAPAAIALLAAQQPPGAGGGAAQAAVQHPALPPWFQTALAWASRAREYQLAYLLGLYHQAAAASGGMPPVHQARAIYRHALARFSSSGVFRPPGLLVASPAAASPFPEFDAFLLQAMSMLSHAGYDHMLACPHDPSLPAPANASRVALAVNLHNSAPIMPNFLLQLLRLLLEVQAGNAFVLMYESGSTDATQLWLHTLQLILDPIGVPHNITGGGGLVRQKGQERISYLAAVRNALIQPFYDGCDDPRWQQQHQQQHARAEEVTAGAAAADGSLGAGNATEAAPGAAGSSDAAGSGVAAAAVAAPMPAACFQPDRFLFINDVYWCPDDALRLLAHDADMTCGLDLGMQGAGLHRRAARRLHSPASDAEASGGDPAAASQLPPWADLHGNEGHGSQLGRTVREAAAAAARRPRRRGVAAALRGCGSAARSNGRSLQASDERFRAMVQDSGDDASRRPNYGVWRTYFYDTWVARDIDGRKLDWERPFAVADRSKARVSQGLPTPVYCCWNGMAAVTAVAFAQGVRFRTHVPGECMASECSLLCDDLHRMGYRRVLLDPGVRVTYGYAQKWLLHSPHFDVQGMTGIKNATWGQVAAAGAVDWSDAANTPSYDSVECCDMLPEHDLIADWGKQCHMVNALAPNHTATFLAACLEAIQLGNRAGQAPLSYLIRKHEADGSVHVFNTDCPARASLRPS